jgi:hypothetical protein
VPSHPAGGSANPASYRNLNIPELNHLLQPRFGRIRLGINAFSIRHRNYADTMFELLMSGGRNFVAPNF